MTSSIPTKSSKKTPSHVKPLRSDPYPEFDYPDVTKFQALQHPTKPRVIYIRHTEPEFISSLIAHGYRRIGIVR